MEEKNMADLLAEIEALKTRTAELERARANDHAYIKGLCENQSPDMVNGTLTSYAKNAFQTENARVQVYVGNSNIPSYTFTVPNSGSGRWWNVFKYNATTKTIIPVNTVS